MARVQKVAVPVPVPAPRHFQWPWRQIVLAVAILVAVGAVAYGVSEFVSRVGDATAPAVPAVQQPVAVPSVPSPQVPQNVQENVGVAAPVVVDYLGNRWNPTKDFNPGTIPVAEGLYDGTMNNMGWGSTERPEGRAYALKVYPEFKDALAVLVAIARDPVDKDVVLLSVFADYLDKPYTIRIALTVNGGKSWCNLPDLLPVSSGDAGDVRVLADNNLIRLYGQDARPGYYWWERVEKRSELPCS